MNTTKVVTLNVFLARRIEKIEAENEVLKATALSAEQNALLNSKKVIELTAQNAAMRLILDEAIRDMLHDAQRTINTYGYADTTYQAAEEKAKRARSYMALPNI